MFEELAHGDDLSHVADGAVVDAITGWARAEAAAASQRLSAIAELTDRRCASDLAKEREYWACDGWDSAAAEVAAALGIAHRAASSQMHQGLALRHRLPQVGKLLAEGAISAKHANTISWRTQLIEDPEVLAQVDADLTAAAGSFGPMSTEKLETAIDAAITVHDPASVRRFQRAAKGCDVKFGDRDDETGTRSIWGRMTITDAALVEPRIDQLARKACPHDPRTVGERRSQAFAVLACGGTQLPCLCRRPDCAAAGSDARADAIVVHVLTDRYPDAGQPPDSGPGPDSGPPPDSGPDDPPSDPDHDHEPPPDAGSGGPVPDSKAESNATSPGADPSGHQFQPVPRSGASGLAVIAGGGIVPTPLLSELVRLGVPVRLVPSACELEAEPRYRPSAKLARFVRSRDLTCCFPGCGKPAEFCDLDHTTPHGVGGLTHPGNTKCLCRKHHLLKTFWTGPTGWTDQQLPDGIVAWISPTGHRYTQPPGSRLLFPRWDTTTPLPAGTATPPAPTGSSERGLTMPTRKHTRVHQNAQRRRAERRRNQRAIDEDPPPF